MTEFNLRHYAARETAIGIVINMIVATAPSIIFINLSATAALRPVHEVAVGLTPQFFMASFMSALVPSLLICWKQARGRSGFSPKLPCLRAGRAAVVAASLAVAFTILSLALIHIVVAPLEPGGLGAGAILAIRIAQAVLAAATTTPLALLLTVRGALAGRA